MIKYKIKKAVLAGSGTLEWRWRTLSSGLYIFNYHRIGDPAKTAFDPNVFSCNESQFEAQIRTIGSKFKVINGDQLFELIDNGKPIVDHLAMITFDDGYEDNYSKAFPILAEKDMPASFFLPTDFIGTNRIPWWDEAAWLVRNTNEKNLKLAGLDQPIAVSESDIAGTIRLVLRWFKDHPDTSASEKLRQLASVCHCELEAEASSNLFMSWDNAREMVKAGMDIGSHTQSHQLLSHLDPDMQRRELEGSKTILEAKIDSTIGLLAYPVGGLDSYTRETVRIAENCGYRAAFNFSKESGFNTNPKENRFELARIPVGHQASPTDIKMSTVGVPRVN